MSEIKFRLKVFLCHSSQDKPIVFELYKRLLSEDWVDPWLDKEKLKLGQDFDTEIEKAIASADAVVAFISKSAVGKTGYIQKELKLIYNAAMFKPEGSLFAIPLRLEECDPPHNLKLWHWGDYFGTEKEKTYESLLKSLKIIYDQVKVERQKELVEEEACEKAKEDAAREEAEKEVAKNVARKEARKNSAEKARLEKEKLLAARKALLKSFLAQATSIIKSVGILIVIVALLWGGSLAIPKLVSTPNPTNVNSIVQQTLLALTSSASTPTLVNTTVPISTTIPTKTRTPTPTSFSLPTEITDTKGISMRLIDTFYIDKFEVTNSRYRECVKAKVCGAPSSTKIGPLNYYDNKKYDNYPVVWVTQLMATSYCKWRSARLPISPEWRRAASGLDKRIYPWGNLFDPKIQYANSWGPGDGYEITSPVGAFALDVSPYNVYDMAGNVSEFLIDGIIGASWYQDYWHQGSLEVNLQVEGKYLPSEGFDINYSSFAVGFRCTKDIKP